MIPDNVLKYKGYTAVVSYDAEDNILVGSVVGVDDIIGFHADSAEEIRKEFKIAIDGYLETCKRAGEKPDKPRGGLITLALPLDLELCLERAAEETGKNTKTLILDAVQAAYRTRK